jgi:hypothetical protein
MVSTEAPELPGVVDAALTLGCSDRPVPHAVRPVARARQARRPSLAWQFFERGTIACRPHLVPAAAWLDTSSDDTLIQEHSIAIGETDTVLTMLWLSSDQPPPCSPSTLPRVDSLPAARRPETSLRVAHRMRAEAFAVMRQTRKRVARPLRG